MLIIIVGCGQMGATIANSLSLKGEDIIVIDKDDRSFRSLSPDFSGFQIVGDALEIELLKKSKIDHADMLLVLTRDDNVNLAISQIGKRIFRVPNAIARVSDPVRGSLFQQLGIGIINPIALASKRLLDEIAIISKNEKTREESI
jgi:trk system potassium uptake protein TrkA